MLTLHGISRIDGGAHDGIHLFWSPPFPTGHSLDGFTIFRRAAKDGRKLQCVDLSVGVLREAREHGVTHVQGLTLWTRPVPGTADQKPAWSYRIDLGRTAGRVDLSGIACVCAFGARSDGTVIDGQLFNGGDCSLRGALLATVWVVVDSMKASFKLCMDLPDADSWRSAQAIVKNLQVPFRSVNAEVASEAEELALAAHRALPDVLGGSFSELSRFANLALERPHGVPAFRVVAGRLGGAQDNWDLAPYALAVSAIVIGEWNRGLGFAHLDRADLVPGEAYDYRITGSVPRADRDELRFDFHTVPRHYRLPQCFVLGPVTIWASEVPEIQAESLNGSPAVLRKGFKFGQLTLDLAVPTRRIVIDGLSAGPIMARGFMLGAHVADVAVGLSLRAEFDFGAPVDRVLLKGEGFLVGLVPQPLDASLDPREPVEISQCLYGIAYVPTAPPPPPSALEVVTLGDPARTARIGAPDSNRGFEASWLPPADLAAALSPWWPVDAGALMPTSIARYAIERKIGNGAFAPRKDTDGLHLGTRLVQTVSDTPAWGFDVLRAFPVMGTVGEPLDERVRAIEVFEREQLEYGDSATWRVRSLDPTGRESAPVVAAPVMLRKLTRPPAPTSPPNALPADTDTPRTGIEVRLLQTNDADLAPADAALTAGGDVVVLRWGWGHEERKLDPYVSEFRVYEHDGPLLEISATLTGAVTAQGSGWRVPVSFSRSVRANEFSGRVVTLNDAFAIASHGAGTTVQVTLQASVRSPSAVPTGLGFTVLRTAGEQLQSEYWDRRVQVVPRASDPAREDDPDYVEEYTLTLPANWIAVSPTLPVQRAGIGITAADAQPYIPDRRLALEAAPRAGNESTVTFVEVRARYRGRPTLAVANLADVHETVLRRLASNDSVHRFTPSAFAPPGSALQPRMRVERVPASAVLPRLLIQNDAILLQSAQGAPVPWNLSPADAADLRAARANGSIPNRFLAHAAALLDGLDGAAVKVGDVNPASEISDSVPNTPARWIYRLRAVDAAGHLSEASQVLGLVLRIPTPARPTVPELVSMTREADAARLTIRSRGTEPATILVFTSLDPRQRLATASLATVRNRPDLDPTASVVVRDDRGVRLTATAVEIAANSVTQLEFSLPDGHRLLAWSLAFSADGIPSPLVGPLHTSRGYLAEVD